MGKTPVCLFEITARVWDNCISDNKGYTVEILFGELEFESIRIPQSGEIKKVYVDGTEILHTLQDGYVCFESVKIKNRFT